jgi:antirestriction protein ArdC
MRKRVQEQIDGLAPLKIPEPPAIPPFIAATKADIRAGAQPTYVPSQDFIAMPEQSLFKNEAHYWATLLHEAGHNAEPRIMPRRPEFSRETQPDRRGNAAGGRTEHDR